MKHLVTIIGLFFVCFSFAQEADKSQLSAFNKANNFIYEGNALAENDDFVAAEMEYRKAISKQASNIAGTYNLGNSYYKKGNFDEALYRHQQAAISANTKPEKHLAYHNIGNTLMQNEKYAEAVEAYKQALRNNPTDDETRYNLALAKKKQKEQEDKQDKNKDDKEDKDKKDDKENEDKKENEDNKDKEGDDKDEKKDEKKDKGEDEKKEDEKKDDEGKPKDEKEDKGKDEEDKQKEQPKPQQGQLSPQQIKNLLEAMNNQEKKVQEKMNAEKQKGVKVKTEKDW